MSASVSDDMIRSYFERWQRLEEEKRAISDDLKELFAEAKGNGFDSKALRTVFREQVGDRAAMEEFDATCELYRASLTAPRARPARSAREIVEEFDAETGEITEQPETAKEMDRATEGSFETGSAAAEKGREAIPAGPEDADLSHAGASESLASEIHERPSNNAEASLEAGPQAEAFQRQGTGARTLAGHEGRSEGEAASADLPTNSQVGENVQVTTAALRLGHAAIPARTKQGVTAGETATHSPSAAHSAEAVAASKAPQPPKAATAPISDDDVPAFLKQDRQEVNERCENPLTCKFGHHPQKVTCSTCSTAWAIAQRKAVAA